MQPFTRGRSARPSSQNTATKHRPGPAGTGLRVLLATALGMMGAITAPAAFAYTPTSLSDPYELGTPDAALPTVNVTTTVSDGTVDPGQKITYSLKVEANAPVPGPQTTPGESNINGLTITIVPD